MNNFDWVLSIIEDDYCVMVVKPLKKGEKILNKSSLRMAPSFITNHFMDLFNDLTFCPYKFILGLCYTMICPNQKHKYINYY